MRDGAGNSVAGPDARLVQRVCAYGTGRIHSAWPSWYTKWSGLWWHASIRRTFWWRPSSIVIGNRQSFAGFRRPFYSTLGSYPAYDYSSGYSVQNDVARQQQDIDRLEDEVARLQEERQAREAPSSTPQAQGKSEPSTPTVLVFRDKHTQEVQNYAVVGGTLWIFNEQRATKLPLSWLDIEATTKANEERGVDFRIPK